jgi:hypothetical protein
MVKISDSEIPIFIAQKFEPVHTSEERKFRKLSERYFRKVLQYTPEKIAEILENPDLMDNLRSIYKRLRGESRIAKQLNMIITDVMKEKT